MNKQPWQNRPCDHRTGRRFRLISLLRAVEAPPRAIRSAKLDNLALVPGSLLPFKARWQAMANSLAAGEVLIVLPDKSTPARSTLESVASSMRAKGRRVTILPVESLR
jgi:hypothetical protein